MLAMHYNFGRRYMFLEIVPLKGFSRIDIADCFEDELKKLFKKSNDDYKKYMKFFSAQLHKIENREENIKTEEPIKYKDITLYSIRKNMKKNTRVLYFYYSGNRIILLTAFDEKDKSDYEKGKERAYKRLKKLNVI